MAHSNTSTMELPTLSQNAGIPQLDGEIRSDGILNGIPFEVWDISETISQLAYLTHNFFRYYGKFPSTLAAGFLNRFASEAESVIDIYSGSGTTHVECLIRGVSCTGVDVNPFAVLATQVKTHRFEVGSLKRCADRLQDRICDSSKNSSLFPGGSIKRGSFPLPSDSHLDKWFSEDVQADLAALKHGILQIRDAWNRKFFLCAYFAIIRRVSNAFDGEVRPHVNKSKKSRSVLDVFNKKVADMLKRLPDILSYTEQNPPNECVAIHGNNRELNELLGETKFDASLSHPPYLNCFDYLPVYRLEFVWSEGVAEIEDCGMYSELRKEETRSWPAVRTDAREQYFNDQFQAYSQLRNHLVDGAPVGVLIGDSTVHKKLIRVHERFVEILNKSGYRVERLIYRTTHYGTGKYSYEHRADYHHNDDQDRWSDVDRDESKRDALIIARAV